MKVIEIRHFADGDQKLVRVPLSNSELAATLYEDDFAALMQLGLSAKWRLHNAGKKDYITVCNNGTHRAVARYIRHAGPKHKVLYKDNDPTNLRMDNLILAPGRGKYDARSSVVRQFDSSRTVLEHIEA